MKDRNKKLLKTLLAIVLPITIIVMLLSFLGVKELKKTYALDEGMNNIAAYVDENDNPTSVSFVLEYLDHNSKENVEGNKVKVIAPTGIQIEFLDAKTNNKITVDNNIVELSKTGTIVKVKGIEKGNTYDITIKPEETRPGVMPAYKKAIIEVNYEDTLKAFIRELRDVNDQVVNLSDNDKMVFLYTDSEDKIKLRGNEDVEISYYYSLDELSEADLETKTFVTYDKDHYLKVETNGYLYAKSRYKTNGYSKINSLHITNIDKLEPTVTVDSVVENSTHDHATVTYSINDQAATREYGKSGITKYAFSLTDTPSETDFITVTGDGTYSNTVDESGRYYIVTYDNAGNKKVEPVDVTITYEEDDAVIFIITSTITDLIGKEYISLDAFKADIAAHNPTSTDTVLAQIEHNIRNQHLDVENIDLTLDLNGYTINNFDNDNTIKVKNGAKLTIIDDKINLYDYFNGEISCYNVGNSIDYSYTGDEQSFVVTSGGKYRLEAWGASGGSYNDESHGGYGGYSTGIIDLNENEELFINVGGRGIHVGSNDTGDGGYNGGGPISSSWGDGNERRSSGGGATHIATVSGLLSELSEQRDGIILVAGGGGGAGVNAAIYDSAHGTGGNGGGFKGTDGTGNEAYGTGGTQEAGGVGDEHGARGLFGRSATSTEAAKNHGLASGAGGGYYGGGTSHRGAGGGSGYIGNSRLTSKHMACLDCDTTNETNTRTILAAGMSGEPIPDYAKNNDGYVKITRVICDSSTAVDVTKYHHGTGDGKILNRDNYAIKVEEYAVLDVGKDNSPDMSHIELPDQLSPYIFGKDGGILVDEDGTFNYYDGVIIGRVSIDGTVADTPPLYDPSTVSDENGYRTVLAKVSNIEALIGKSRYTLLEDAIDAANKYKGTSADQIEIDVVSDITKDFTLDINNTKNIVLDMNGFKLINTVNEPLITNEGKLVIRDATGDNLFTKDKDQYVIQNNTGGELTILNGTFERTNSSYPVVYNGPDATMTIKGGTYKTVTSIFGYSCREAIYNEGGILNIEGGEIKGTSCNYWGHRSGYGLTNKEYYSDTLDEAAKVTMTTFTDYSKVNYEYGFTVNSDGHLESTNGMYPGSKAYALVKLDTTGIPAGSKVKVEITYNHQANVSNCATLNVLPNNIPDTSGACLYGTRGDTVRTIDTYVSGDNLYLNVYEPMNAGATPNPDNKFIVKKVEITPYITYAGRLNISGGTFNQAYKCVNNAGRTNNSIITGGDFTCDVSVGNGGTGILTITGGNFRSQVLNGDKSLLNITNGTFSNVTNEGGNLNYSGGTAESFNHNRPSFAINEYKDMLVTNITGGTIGIVTNYFTTNISNTTITDQLKNYSEVPMLIENSTFDYSTQLSYDGEYYNIYIDNIGDTTFNNVIINEQVKSRDGYSNGGIFASIFKKNTSNLYLNNVTINEHGIAGTTLVQSNTPDPINKGIYNKGSGNIYTTGLKINQTSDNEKYLSDGVYNLGTGSFKFGNKDNIYHEDDSVISSLRYGLYSPSSEFTFYDGVIKGKELATPNVISDLENGYYLLKENSDGYNIYKQSNIGPQSVLHVETGNRYNSLGEALSSVGSQATLKVIGDELYEVYSFNHTITSSQDITIDFNGKNITLGAGLINNGKLTIVDNGESTALINTHQIINNNVMSITGGKWIIEYDNTSGILNNGNLTVNNIDVSIKEAHDNQAIFENNGVLTVDGSQTKMTVGDYKTTKLFRNKYTGRLYINNGTYTVTSGTEYDKNSLGYVLYNEGGYAEINGGTFNVNSNINHSGYSYAFYGIPGTIPEFANTSKEDGVVSPTNNNWLSTNTPIDLRGYSGTVTLKIRFNKDESNETSFYLATDNTNMYVDANKFYTTSDLLKNETITTTVTGGSLYYLGMHAARTQIRDIIISYNGTEESLFHRGKIVINDGTINESATSASFMLYNSDLEMTGGLLTRSDEYRSGEGIRARNGADLKFTGGTITKKGIPIYFEGYSHAYINGLNLVDDIGNGSYRGLYIYAGIVDIDDINIDATVWEDGYGIWMFNYSKVNMNGGNITLKGGRSLFGVRMGDDYNDYPFTLNLNNSEIDVSTIEIPGHNYGDTDTYGIYPERGAILNIGNSSVIASSANKSYGIYVPGDRNTTITLSNNDTAVSEVTPVIKGNTYGFYRQAGTFNYYDGIIKGGETFYGGVTDRPETYELVYGTEGDLKTVVLRKTILVVNTDTGTEYSSIDAAITACHNNAVCNLKLLYQAALSSQLTIPATKEIVFDLNDLKITTSNALNIVNNGNIKFTNGKLDSEGTQDYSGIIENNGILTIDDVTITDYDATRSNLITNNASGSVYIISGTLKNNGAPNQSNQYSDEGTLIRNLGGYVEITNATMEAKSQSDHGITNGIYTTATLPEGIIKNYGGYSTDNNYMYFDYYESEIAIPLDLTGYTGNVNVGLKTHPTRTDYVFKAWITSSTSVPTDSDTPFVDESTDKNYTATYSYSTTVAGGNTYYLHIKTMYNSTLSSVTLESNGETTDLFKHGKVVIKNIDYKDAGNDAMILSENGIVEIQGGNLYTADDGMKGIGIRGRTGAVINMSGGTINNRVYGVYLETGATLNTTGGTLSATKGDFYGINSVHGSVNLNNTTISGTSTSSNEQMGVISNGLSDVTVNNSSITINTRGRARGFFSEGNPNVNINSSTVDVTGNSETIGIYVRSGREYTINKSTITSNYRGIYVDDHIRCIVNFTNNDGNDDGNVSTELPYINSATEALHGNDTKFNFYDGKISGDPVYIHGMNDVPAGYLVEKTTSGSKEVWTLSKSNVVLNVNNNTEYNTLQGAIDACPNSTTCTIQPLKDFYNYSSVTINNNKEIVLDLNNKTVYMTDANYIVNNGILTVENGTMKNNVGINQNPIIENNNRLTLESTAALDSDNYIYSRLITNNKKAKLYVNGATLSNNEVEDSNHGAMVNGKSIYNNGGYVEINGATFNTTSKNHSIYTTSDPDMPTKHTNNFTLKNTDGSIENVNGGSYYIPIDLTGYSGNVNIEVGYSTYANYNYKYYITTSNELPTTLTTVDHVENISVMNKSFNKDVTGGNMYYLHVIAGSTSRINDIRITTSTTSESIFNKGTVVVNNVTANYKGSGAFIYAQNSDVIIHDGVIKQTETATGTGIELTNVSDLKIDDLEIKEKNVGISATGYSTVLIDNLDYNCTVGRNHVGLSFGQADVIINDLTLYIAATGNSNDGIYTSGTSNVVVNKADIDVYAPEGASGIEVAGSSNVTIKENVDIKTDTSTTGVNGLNGIYVSGSQATVTVGINEGTVSRVKPVIYGKTRGINKAYGTFNFYDGVFKSPDTPIYGMADDVPEGYQVILNGDESYLGIESHLDNTFFYNNQYFQSLDTIMDVISQQTVKKGTIKVNNDAPITSTVVIPSEVEITLALEGHALDFDGLEKGIINRGTLTIVDDVNGEFDPGDTSMLVNDHGIVIDNQGTLTLGATGMSDTNSPIIKGTAAIIGNSYTKITGQVISTDNTLAHLFATAMKSLIRFFAGLFEPTYAYKTSDYQINNLDDDIVLAESPNIRTVEELTTWTNKDINVGMTSHNYGILNIVSSIDETQRKELKYTVEFYQDNKKVDSIVKTKDVQVLSDNNIDLDTDLFNSIHGKYSGYNLSKVYLNNVDITTKNGGIVLPTSVESGSIFKIYYSKIPLTPTTKRTSPSGRGTTTTTEPITDPTTETTTTTTTSGKKSTTTTEEVKGEDVVKKPFPWWIVAAVAGGLGFTGLLIWLLPLLLRKSVLIAVSGSVGSAVAAKLLQERQCKVTALFINNGTNLQQLANAKQVCSKLGIDLYEQEINGEYRTRILEGITNNPNTDLDKIYNKYVLIDMLKQVAKEQHIKYISTGIYARKQGNKIISGVNQVFDESDKLSLLTEDDIKKLLLPLGEIEYQEINQIAEQNNINYGNSKQSAIDKIGNNNIPSEVIDKLNK